MNDKLKPCPFCGGKVKIVKEEVYYRIQCSLCPVDFGRCWFPKGDNRKNKMIKAWNERKR